MSSRINASPDEIQGYAQTVFGYLTGQFVSYMIHLGDRMGLYKTMSTSGAVSAADLANTTGYKERWLLEWLRNQTAAGLINYDSTTKKFSLSPAALPILVDETNPFNIAGFFEHPVSVDELGRVVEAFETGLGVSYNEQGGACACAVKRFTSPGHTQLVEFLQRVDGLHEKLEAGATVVDVGCGAGVALIELARAYPKSTFEGYDPATAAIEMALTDTEEAGLTNITYHIAGGEDLPQQPKYDLVLTLDCLHDMPFPQQVLNAIRGSIKSDGVLIIKDIKCSDNFEENLANPFSPALYGISVLICMSSALSEPGGAGLGTMGFNPVLGKQMAESSGFSSFEQLPIVEDIFNNFYEVRV